MIRKTLAALVGLAALVVIIMWMSGMFRERVEPGHVKAPVQKLAPDVATSEIHLVVEHQMEEAVGTLRAERRTMISSKILATIEQLKVRAGDKVEKGDVIAVLDDRDLKSKVAQAEQNVTSLEASLDKAKSDYESYKKLFAERAVSKTEYDRIETTYKMAQAQLDRARQAVREAEVALTNATIKSPVSGKVVDRLMEPGDLASPGRAILSVYDPTALRLEAPVRELLATTLNVGDLLQVRIDALNLTLDGRIDEIVPEAEAASRSFLVKVGIPFHEGLYSGMFGRLIIPAGERQRVCMNRSALQTVGQLEFVHVVQPDNTVQRRMVVTGEHSEFGNVEVLSGVAPGDVVVLGE